VHISVSDPIRLFRADFSELKMSLIAHNGIGLLFLRPCPCSRKRVLRTIFDLVFVDLNPEFREIANCLTWQAADDGNGAGKLLMDSRFSIRGVMSLAERPRGGKVASTFRSTALARRVSRRCCC
jgi:hypothetical protein